LHVPCASRQVLRVLPALRVLRVTGSSFWLPMAQHLLRHSPHITVRRVPG
jgi:hypothetical protein